MRNFWDEDPAGDDVTLWLCAIFIVGCSLYGMLA